MVSSWKLVCDKREIVGSRKQWNDRIWPMHYHMQFVNEQSTPLDKMNASFSKASIALILVWQSPSSMKLLTNCNALIRYMKMS